MTRNSTIRENLLADVLVDVVDDIRRIVHGALGTRPYEVAVVTRRWSGTTRGEGEPSFSVLVLDPAPHVSRSSADRLGPGGREGSGSITLTGISLRYAENELLPKVDERTEVAYRIREAHGQRQRDRWFLPSGAPVPRRGDSPGDQTDWTIRLHEVAGLDKFDGEDA